jgi:iron complex outermembrane receptor protein
MSTYAKYSTDMKAGGFNAGTTQIKRLETFIYESEEAINWELGVKGTLLDRRVSYNLTLYWMEFEGLQVAALNPLLGESVTVNVGGQRNRGAEFNG